MLEGEFQHPNKVLAEKGECKGRKEAFLNVSSRLEKREVIRFQRGDWVLTGPQDPFSQRALESSREAPC